MKTNPRTNSRKVFALLTAVIFGLSPLLKADVIVLQSGAVITGNILQQDANGVLMQMEYGTFRYPLAMIKDVKKEAATAPHVSNNGQVIPDWAQIVTMLANSSWAPEIKQVPATVIDYGKFNKVPYVSFRCASGGYELNIFGDLNNPAAVEIGAMSYLNNSAEAKSNCVNFICSVLANAADRKMVRALNWSQKDVQQNGNLSFETLMPGEWGSYGGWCVMAFDRTALANAAASDAEMLALAQPRVPAAPPVAAAVQPAATTANDIIIINTNPPPPAATSAQPVTTTTTTYGTDGYYGWSAQELADAHPAVATPAATTAATYPTAMGAYKPADTSGMIYPRTYTRAGGAYDVRR
jgi:hypothetical protein